jgi:hypothetical protein
VPDTPRWAKRTRGRDGAKNKKIREPSPARGEDAGLELNRGESRIGVLVPDRENGVPSPDPNRSPHSDWVDDRELARRTPIKRATWQKWRRTGDGPPYYKISGRRVLYKWREVNTWLGSDRVGGAS